MAMWLLAKLKALKGNLKEWHSSAFGRVDCRIDAQVEALKLLEGGSGPFVA
jgi:hypothetical protein